MLLFLSIAFASAFARGEEAVAKPRGCSYGERMQCMTARDGTVECNCITWRNAEEEAVAGGEMPKDCKEGDTWTSDDFCSSGSCVDLGEPHGTTWMTMSMACYYECREGEELVDIPGQCCGTCQAKPKTCDESECLNQCKGRGKKRKCTVAKDSVCEDKTQTGKGKKKKMVSKAACKKSGEALESAIASSKSMACPHGYYKVCKENPSGFDCKCTTAAKEAELAVASEDIVCTPPKQKYCVTYGGGKKACGCWAALETEVGGCSSSNWCSKRCISHQSTDANGPYGCDCSACSSDEVETALAALPTCACSGGNQKGTSNGDKVCEWNRGNCSKFREGCPKPCIMQKEKAVGDASFDSDQRWGTYRLGNYFYHGDGSSEKAVGDASSDQGYGWRPNLSNYWRYHGDGSSEKAVGDASSDQGYGWRPSLSNYWRYHGDGSSEKAVGDASSDQRYGGFSLSNYLRYYGDGSSEKAVGDASSEAYGYRGWRFFGDSGDGSSEKAVGDASSEAYGYRRWRFFGDSGDGSSEKAVGDASSEQGYNNWYNLRRFYGYGSGDGSSEKAVGDASSDGHWGYNGWHHFGQGYYGDGSSEKSVGYGGYPSSEDVWGYGGYFPTMGGYLYDGEDWSSEKAFAIGSSWSLGQTVTYTFAGIGVLALAASAAHAFSSKTYETIPGELLP